VKVKETRAKCAACGNVWHYGKAEQLESAGAALQNVGSAMMCCSGCWPAALIPQKKVVDLRKCPKCGSKATTSETVEHEVP
jgi:DNA-directed RNA polymerase subunit M/transcription elongation factor TFIIS